MAKFTLTIKLDNDAFSDGNRDAEIARILHDVAERVEMGYPEMNLYDINGNKVGETKATR